MLHRLARNKLPQLTSVKSSFTPALTNMRASQRLNILGGSIPARFKSSSLELTGLQMHNKMFVTKSVLDKQVEIMKDENIPKQLKLSDEYVYRHMGNSDISSQKILDTLGVKTIDELME